MLLAAGDMVVFPLLMVLVLVAKPGVVIIPFMLLLSPDLGESSLQLSSSDAGVTADTAVSTWMMIVLFGSKPGVNVAPILLLMLDGLGCSGRSSLDNPMASVMLMCC